MKTFIHVAIMICLTLSVGLVGCGQQKAASSQEAIEQAKALETAEAQTQYLISQANKFINSKEFNEAVSTAQYILRKIDRNSDEAKSIIEMAKAEIQKAAQDGMEDTKSKMGFGSN